MLLLEAVMSPRHAMLLPAVASALLASAASAAELGSPASNQLYGHITSDRTITYASPGPNYEIIGDLTIDPGVTLTVERGVTLAPKSYSDFLASGMYRGLVEINVQGSLVVPPGPGAVIFESDQSPPAGVQVFAWAGIHVAATGFVSLPNVIIVYAMFGLYIDGTGTVAPGDSLTTAPTWIEYCGTGIQVVSGAPALEHILISNCTYGLNFIDGQGTVLNYCTLIDNTVACTANAYMQSYAYNVLLDGDMTGGRSGVRYPCSVVFRYSDVWGYANTDASGGFGPAGPGGFCSSYNPYLSGSEPPYQLSPASFFTNYSVSGGQIGAYGPGPNGLPTPIATASLVSAEASDGVANVRWYVGQDGQKASIVRRVDGGDWAPLTVLLRDGTGFVTLQDASVTPGTRYGYAIGTQNNGHIGLDGEVWLTVQPHVAALSRPTISPNPAPDGWNVSFAAPATENAKLEILDVSGRLLSSRDLGALQIGQNSTFVSAGSLSPGIYWVRVRQENHATMARAVKTR